MRGSKPAHDNGEDLPAQDSGEIGANDAIVTWRKGHAGALYGGDRAGRGESHGIASWRLENPRSNAVHSLSCRLFPGLIVS
jgi:hypothetical protein